MNLDEFRREMAAYRVDASEAATRFKDQSVSRDRLHALYRKFDADERAMADQVIAEWAQSEDGSERFDARVLIYKWRIISALPALEKLAERLALSGLRRNTGELEMVNRLIGELAQS